MKTKHLSKARGADIITTLPQTIIEIILCLLPIEEAARTSILSREWRYKWTKIPKLVFPQYSTVNISTEVKELHCCIASGSVYARREKILRWKLFGAIHQVLLQRQAPILDFTLKMDAHHTYSEIDQIILHLSRNHTLKKLTLEFYGSGSYGVPLSIFSLHHLTDLYLESCHINHKPIFNGFSSLTSLTLDDVRISQRTLLHLLSNCPSLKILCLFILGETFSRKKTPNIMELFKSLPVIEHLTTWDYTTLSFVLDAVPQGISTSLFHLKYFHFKDMGIVDCNGLTFLFVFLKCSPNLKKIKLKIDTDPDFLLETANSVEYSGILEEHSDVCLEHLNELKIEDFINSKLELDLVKFILARSPSLKKVILVTYLSTEREELELLHILLRAPRASPVEIFVDNHCPRMALTHMHPT